MACKCCANDCRCTAVKCGDNCNCDQSCKCTCKNGSKDDCCKGK